MPWPTVLTVPIVVRVGFERAQPNDTTPGSPLTTKGHFNAQRSKGRLRAAEPAGEGSGRFWPPYTRPRRVISWRVASDAQQV